MIPKPQRKCSSYRELWSSPAHTKPAAGAARCWPTPQTAHEFPAQDQIMSGNNVVSGWFFSALRVTIQFDNFSLVDVPYGGQRNDTIPACGDANNGYASIFPYPALGPGLHRLRVRVDGVVRADITFTVVTFNVEFLSGVTGEGRVTLSNGQEAISLHVRHAIQTQPHPSAPPTSLLG